jgi:Trp operon repressor
MTEAVNHNQPTNGNQHHDHRIPHPGHHPGPLVGLPHHQAAPEMSTDMSATPNVTVAVEPLLVRLRKAPATRRVQMAQGMYQQLTDLQATVAAERRAAVRELREQGLTLGEIATTLGVSISRIKQMEDGPRKVKLTPEQEVAKLERQLARAQAEVS